MTKDKLPGGWVSKILGDIFVFEEKSKRKAGDGQETGKYKFFTSSETQTLFINESDYEGEKIIFGTGGNATVHYCDTPCSSSADCFVVSTTDEMISKYAYYYLIAHLHLVQRGFRGAGLKHLSKNYLKKVPIKFPEDTTVQQKIVSILEKGEEAKRLREETDELTKDFLKSVFLDMFGDPVLNPKEWNLRKLSEFGEITTGNTPPRKDKKNYGDYIEWIKSDNITSDIFLTHSREKLSQEGARLGRVVPPGTILVCCIAGSISSIGRAAIANREVAFNQQINALIPNNNVNSYFLCYLLLISQKIIQSKSTQALKGIVNKSTFSSMIFPLPPKDLQDKFGLIVEEILKLKSHQSLATGQHGALLNALMQKAFKGDLL